jgi:outer membrane protein, multidrug efflux system
VIATRFAAAVALLSSIAVVGCVKGPNYSRPLVAMPEAFRAPPVVGQPGDTPSLGDTKWWEVFQDDELQSLIRAALERNYDARIAAARVLEAQAQAGIVHADLLPSVSAGAALLGQRFPAALFGSTRNVGAGELSASAFWELDFWGRLRRATEAARAQLLATEWGRRAVITTLISRLADAYFTLRTFDLQLEITTRTLDSRQESLRLTEVRERGGATSLLDVRQAEQLVYGAKAEIVNLERAIDEQENLVRVLVGDWPSGVSRGRSLTDQPRPGEVPAGLPSALLERRPDILQAEQQLVAANAQIGVAKAAYFPQITLTGSGGVESAALSSLFAGPSVIWSAALGAVQPVFTGGRLRSQVELAEARHQEALLTYERTIQYAFREVSDALVGYRKARELRAEEELLVSSARDARRLADVRYEGGATSYLEVLDADSRLFIAELALAQAQLSELAGLVDIYRALGGGWQP